jgi:hypothetical protein
MYEYGTSKPLKAILRRRRRKKENDRGDGTNLGTLFACMEMSQTNSMYNYTILIKPFKKQILPCGWLGMCFCLCHPKILFETEGKWDLVESV